jgi:protein-S-isoprenylcysteine O-methyltransferase Ste14
MRILEHRIPPPLVFVIVAVGMWAVARIAPAIPIDNALRLAIAGALFLLGPAFALPAFVAFRRARTTANPVNIEAASTLVTGGVYGLSRNPMYVGLTALLASWAAYLAVPWVFPGPVVFVLFITRFQIIPEERVMHAKFGAAYDDYQKRVRRWL